MTAHSQPNAHSPRYPWLATAALLFVAIVWGASFSASKQALLYLPLLWFLALRFGLTAILSLPLVWRELAALSKRQWRTIVLNGLALLTVFLLETTGLMRVGAGLAAVLISLVLLFTPLFEWLMLRQRPGKVLIAAIVLAMVGIALLQQPTATDTTYVTGALLMIGAAIVRAWLAVRSRQFLSVNPPCSALCYSTLQNTLVALGCTLLAWLSSDALPALPSAPSFWLAMAFLVIGCTLLSFWALNYGIAHSSASYAAFITGLEPLFGVLVAMLWLQESLSLQQLAGVGIILLACALMLRPPALRRQNKSRLVPPPRRPQSQSAG